MGRYVKTFENFVPKRLIEREAERIAREKITSSRIKELKKGFKENLILNQIYVLTSELNGENLITPSDIDFEEGSEFYIENIKKDTIIVSEVDADYDDNEWAFDLKSFVNNSKKK